MYVTQLETNERHLARPFAANYGRHFTMRSFVVFTFLLASFLHPFPLVEEISIVLRHMLTIYFH